MNLNMDNYGWDAPSDDYAPSNTAPLLIQKGWTTALAAAPLPVTP